LKSQLVSLALVLAGLVIGIEFGFLLRDQLVTGKTYSPAVIVGFDKFIYRNTSPSAYWIFTSAYIVGLGNAMFFVLRGLLEIITEQRRRTAAKTQRRSLTESEPNQPPLQTPTSVTPAAGAPGAPPSGAAGL